ncbi:hypothetical protein PTKIN_Ptkin09bG0291000 [Pterospermum kingtungense]
MAAVKFVCALLLCMLVVETMAATTSKTCLNVEKKLFPCLPYLKNGGYLSGSSPCCLAVKALHKQTKTTTASRAVCNCLKNAVKTIPGIKPNLAKGLPGKCHVSIPYQCLH